MTSTPTMPGIKDSTTLMNFIKSHGLPKLGKFTNNETGEEFKSLMFPTPFNGQNNTPVSFSSKLGELTMEQVFQRRYELSVVTLNTGSYVLCTNGEGGWESSTHTAAEWGL